jgi:mannose-6-phosphate isomerase-like protein (cupin superfamily)
MQSQHAFALAAKILALHRDGTSSTIEVGPGIPPSLDGWNVGIANMRVPPPHSGEMHPEGDEFIYLISGAIAVVLEEQPQRIEDVNPGECFIVPRGVWHRLLIKTPCQLLFITPGPRNEYRPKI